MKKIIMIGLCIILLSVLVNADNMGYKLVFTDKDNMNTQDISSALFSDFENIIIDKYQIKIDELEHELNLLSEKIVWLEEKLNITDYTTKPDYICIDTGEEAKCPFGITTLTGKHTRCYTEEGQFWWDAKYCKTDWELKLVGVIK